MVRDPDEEPEVLVVKPLGMQVCVPVEWTDAQVVAFAESYTPGGTTRGWYVRPDGDPDLQGDPARNPCSERAGFVHIVLDV